MTCEVGINLMSYGHIYTDLPGLTQQLKYRTYSSQKNKLHLLTLPLGSIRSGTHFEPVYSPVTVLTAANQGRERDLQSSAKLTKLEIHRQMKKMA